MPAVVPDRGRSRAAGRCAPRRAGTGGPSGCGRPGRCCWPRATSACAWRSPPSGPPARSDGGDRVRPTAVACRRVQRRYSTPVRPASSPDHHLAGHGLGDHPGAGGTASSRVFSALYLACAGQLGMQLELPSQRRPRCSGRRPRRRPVAPATVIRRVGRRVAPTRHRDRHAGRYVSAADPHRFPVEAWRHTGRGRSAGSCASGRRSRAGTAAPVRLVLDVGRDADLVLGLGVPRHQVVVAQRPVDADPVGRLHREVGRHHPEAGPYQCRVVPPGRGGSRCRTAAGPPARSSRFPGPPVRSSDVEHVRRRCGVAVARRVGHLGTGEPWRSTLDWYSAQVCPVASPASRTTTCLPASARRRARIAPEMPAPTMRTSQSQSSSAIGSATALQAAAARPVAGRLGAGGGGRRWPARPAPAQLGADSKAASRGLAPFASRHVAGSWFQLPVYQSTVTLRAIGPRSGSPMISVPRCRSSTASARALAALARAAWCRLADDRNELVEVRVGVTSCLAARP